MFNIHIIRILMLFVTLLFLISCKDHEVEKKIDANLKLKIMNLKQSSQLDQILSVVFKTNEPLTEVHNSVLQKKDIKIIANIGLIYTATLPVRSLYDLAKMRFVESIQGSRELEIHPPDSTEKIQQF